MTITSRLYDRNTDYFHVRDFLILLRKIQPYPHNCNTVRWDYCAHFGSSLVGTREEWEEDIHLWEDHTGRIVGVASREEVRGTSYVQIHPDYRHLENEMWNWMEDNIALEKDGKTIIGAVVLAADSFRQALLTERGYIDQGPCGYQNECDLDWEISEPVVPKGYTLRNLSDSAEDREKRCWASWYGFHGGEDREPNVITEGEYQYLQSAPGYDRELDIVVEGPQGNIVAFALGWYEPTNLLGSFEPVATHYQHRRKGLSRACLHEGMRRLQTRGAVHCTVGSAGDGPAPATYRAIGFNQYFPEHYWKKEW